MQSISLLTQFLVRNFYRPLVVVLLLVMVSACVPPPEQPRPQTQRKPAAAQAPIQSKPPVFRPPPVVTPASRPTSQSPFVRSDAQLRPPPALAHTIAALGRDFPGRVGIAVTRVDSGWIVDHQGSQLFPQHSVSKTWVGLALADAIDKGQIRFSDRVTITKTDLTLFHQPIKQFVDDDGYETTVEDLFYRAMTQSDNTANDVLLWRVGGPDAVRRFITNNGLGNIRFGPGERKFQSAIAGLEWRQDFSQGRAFEVARNKLSAEVRGQAMIRYLNDPLDGAAPNAVVVALAKLKRGELLSSAMTRTFLNTMESALTGKQRVKAGVPPGWTYGHKTGTGQVLDGLVTGYNDVGIMTAPDGTSYALAILIRSTRAPTSERQALMQAVAAAVAANHRR